MIFKRILKEPKQGFCLSGIVHFRLLLLFFNLHSLVSQTAVIVLHAFVFRVGYDGVKLARLERNNT